MVENLITRLVTAPGGIVGQNIDSCITIHYPHSVQHQNQVQETVAGYHYVGAEAPHSSDNLYSCEEYSKLQNPVILDYCSKFKGHEIWKDILYFLQ